MKLLRNVAQRLQTTVSCNFCSCDLIGSSKSAAIKCSGPFVFARPVSPKARRALQKSVCCCHRQSSGKR
eukprot:10345188-Alexandrium_andersonii.AAC.1